MKNEAIISSTVVLNRPIAFVAHMDHPGFELSEAEATNACARMLGRTPDAVFTGRFGLRVYQAGSSEFIRGWTSGSKDPEVGDARERLLDIETEVPVSLPAWAAGPARAGP